MYEYYGEMLAIAMCGAMILLLFRLVLCSLEGGGV